MFGESHDKPTDAAIAILTKGAAAVDDTTGAVTRAMSKEEQERITKAIREAKTLDEVKRLEALLRSGKLPKVATASTDPNNDVDMSES